MCLEDSGSSIHSFFIKHVQVTMLKSKLKVGNGRRWTGRKRPDHGERVRFYFVDRGTIAEFEQGSNMIRFVCWEENSGLGR